MNFLPIPRNIIDTKTFKHPLALKVYIWCWQKLRYQQGKERISLGQYSTVITTGQFVTGRNSGAEMVDMPSSTFRNQLRILKEDNLISIKAYRNFSVITVKGAKEHYLEAHRKGQLMDNEKTQTNNVNSSSKGRKLTVYEEKLKEKHRNAFQEENNNAIR